MSCKDKVQINRAFLKTNSIAMAFEEKFKINRGNF